MISPDAWLSGVLGYETFAVDASGGFEPEAFSSHAAARARARALYFAKVPVDRVGTVTALERAGFSVVDTNVTYRLKTTLSAETPDPAYEIAVFGDARLEPALLDLAGSCFRFSRFHLDPLLSPATADLVKREWVASYLAGRRGVELLTASEGAGLVGFLAVLESEGPDYPVRSIDLIGVAEARQGRGVGRALVRAFISRHASGARHLEVGTQIANTSSIALYESAGFRLDRAAYVLHYHVGASP